jgi:predicted lipoprotein with Yx(FWY)xxD motif
MKIPALMAVTAASLLTLSACGSSSSTTASPPSGGTNANANVAASAANGLHVATTSLGKVLADAGGNTVYMFSTDSSGKSTCNATCLQYWPPVAPGKAAPTVTGKVASTTTTTGGKVATVAGWPVYTFSQDHKPGDITGEGFSDFGGVWYAVSPSGQPLKAAGGSSPSGSSSAPTYGGGGGL